MDVPTKNFYQRILGRDEIPEALERIHDSMEVYTINGGTTPPGHQMMIMCALVAGERAKSGVGGPVFYQESGSPAAMNEILATQEEVAPVPPAAAKKSKAPGPKAETPALPVEPAVAPPLNGKPIIGIGGFDWRQFIGKEVECDSSGWKKCTLIGFDDNQNASIKWKNRKQPKHGVELDKLRPLPPEDAEE